MSSTLAPPGSGTDAERALLQAAEHIARAAQGWMVLVMHLSRLPPPAPRPYHRRIARAILQDAAQRQGGQVFSLGNSDMVLLCQKPVVSAPAQARPDGNPASRRKVDAAPGAVGMRGLLAPLDPVTLPQTLARLFRIDMPTPVSLLTIWRLDTDFAAFLEFARNRVTEAAQAPPLDDEAQPSPTAIDLVSEALGRTRSADLLHRHTAVMVTRSEDMAGDVLRPVFREIEFSPDALQARIPASVAAQSDPFLARHLARQLDQRLLDILLEGDGPGSPLALAGFSGTAPALHVNLAPASVISPGFADFATACHAAGATVGVEIMLVDACADPAAYAQARARLAELRMRVVLDGVNYLALLMTDASALHADLIKLEWSPRLADTQPGRVAAALQRLDARRVVLYRAETEAALAWGVSQGIRRFQGRHIDAMRGASRIGTCALAVGCTLRQCIERAATIGRAGRQGCGNTSLLDGAHRVSISGRTTA